MRKSRIVTPHSDESPELNPDSTGDNPLATYTTEGSAISDLYKDRDPTQSKLSYKPREYETIVYEEVYIPDVDHDG